MLTNALSDAFSLPLLMLLAKVTLILVAAFGAAVVLQRAAAGARHLVWAGTLGAVLVLPAIAAWSPLRLAVIPTALPASPSAPARTAGEPIASLSASRSVSREVKPSGRPLASPMAATAIDDVAWKLSSVETLLFVWAAIALVLGGWLALGFYSVHRIVRRATSLDSHDWTAPLYEIADRLGVARTPRIVRSSDVKMPFAAGLLTPTLVLPAECDGWDDDRRSAVLMHELAHIRRHDLLGHTLGRIACVFYWFHPLVWSAARRLRVESERACDDLALTCGLRATSYAEHLLDIVSNIRQPLTPSVAIPMADRREFEGRMLAILDPGIRRRSGRVQSVALVAVVATVTLLVGGAVPAAGVSVAAAEPAALRVIGRSVAFNADTATSYRIAKDKRTDYLERANVPAPLPVQAPARPRPLSTLLSPRDRLSPSGEPTNAAAALTLADRLQGKSSDDRPALLVQILRTDTSATLRRVAAWGLRQYAERQDVARALVEALRGDRSAGVREMVAWSLSESEDSRTVTTALMDALRRDSDANVRETAAWSLGSIGAEGADDALIAALGDASSGTRAVALWSLGRAGEGKAPRQVVDALADADVHVREMAAWVLFNREDPATVPALERALTLESNKALRLSYIRALGAIGEASAPALARLLDSSDGDLRATVVNALAGRAAGPWPMPMPRPRPYP